MFQACVLSTPNLSGEPWLINREIYLYSARIPRILLDYFLKPKPIIPTYDPISVSCVAIPVEPVESLRERIFCAMPEDGRDGKTPGSGED